jgi:hypothetical protein
MALTPEQRDLIDLARTAERLTDGVLSRFWERLLAIFRGVAGRVLTREDRRPLIREIDRVLDRTYGLVQRAALTSELFTAIVRATDLAAETPFRRSIERVKGIVERRDPSWWTRIRARSSPGANDPFLRVLGVLDGPVVERQRMLRANLMDPQRRWTPKETWNTKTGYRLSDRVWNQGRSVRKAIDDRIVAGIRTGDDALKIARSLEPYLNPAFRSETVTRDGKVIARLNQTTTPGRGGYGNYPARRLARTEVTRAHGAATIEAAKVTPGNLGIQWLLSNRHKGIDECNAHATRDGYGLGPGVYPPESVPIYPVHPQDLCTLAPVMKSREGVIADLVKRYGPPMEAAA